METILLRCDYYKGSGAGHLKRSSLLARALTEKGFNTILIIDESNSEILIPLNVKYEKFAFKKFNEIEDAELVIKLASNHNSRIVIGDSYRITNKWIEKIQKNNIKVILIDDLFIGSKADLSINYTPVNSNNKLCLNLNQLRSPKYFITDSKPFGSRVKKRKRIIAHAGGIGDFSKAKLIYQTLAEITDQKSIELSWICPNSQSIELLKKIININSNDTILPWKKNSRNLWSEYEIVLGPASTSLYEAIIQGSVPITFPISKTQCTPLNDWLAIGHTLHIRNEEIKNYDFIRKIIELSLSSYSDFFNLIKKSSKSLDGKGVYRVVSEIEKLINSSTIFQSIENKVMQSVIRICTIEDSEAFLKARNSEEVRQMSTNPEHIIDWPEHLSWWMNTKTDKYVLTDKDNFQEVFFWIKEWEIDHNGFITAGWFPANKKTPFTSILKILDWQIKHYSKKLPGYLWVATVKESNKAAIEFNRRLGFVDATNKSLKVLPIIFPGTTNEFKVLELKC